MQFGQFIKKHPWACGGVIYGIVTGLIFGSIVRRAIDGNISLLIINEAGYSDNAIVRIGIIVVPLVIWIGWGALIWSIFGAIYRGLKSKELIKKHRVVVKE